MEISSRKSLYIRGLQAAYSGVLEVIDDAFHVAVYRYLSGDEVPRWVRMDIEGSAYVTRNNSSPLYSLIVLNKKGSADLILHIEENIEKLQIQDQYIMLRCKNNDGKVVIGIWIHETADRERFFQSILRTKEIRKNSPDMTSLLSKYVLRSKSPVSADASSVSSSGVLQTEGSSPTRPTVSALTASFAAVATTPVRAESDASAKPSDKANALLSLLKSTSKKDLSSVDAESKVPSQVTPSLDDIIKSPESSTPSNIVASSINKSAMLLNILSAKPSSTIGDFPTDGQISAKAKRLQDSPTPQRQQSVDINVKNEALKSALKIKSKSPPRSPSPSTFSRSSSSPETVSLGVLSSTSPTSTASLAVTNGLSNNVALKQKLLSALALPLAPVAETTTATNATSISTTIAPPVPDTVISFTGVVSEPTSLPRKSKLISPADLGEVY